MDRSENEFKLIRNFETLKSHFRINCVKFLVQVVEQLYDKDITSLKESRIFRLLDQKCQEEISKKNNFVLSLPALCNVFENMNENEYKAKSTHLPSTFRYQTFIENVLTLKNLWKTHIVDNDDEKISSEKMQQLSDHLKCVSKEMASQFPDIGKKYVESVLQLQKDENEKEVFASQFGNTNSIIIQDGEQTIYVEQFGNDNKLIVQLEDRTQPRLLELRSGGKVNLRIVLKSIDTSAWETFTERITAIDLSDLNSDPVLKEAGITVNTIERGCVVVSLTTAYGVPIKTSLMKLFAVLFRVLKFELTLRKCNVSELNISGYVYCPERFYGGQDSDKCQQLPIIRHLSWKNLTTICDIDIDIYVTNLMKILIQNGFSTDVDEQLDVQIGWDIGESVDKGMPSCQIPASVDATLLLPDELKTLQLDLRHIIQSEKAIRLRFKCTGKFGYLKLVQEEGILYTITKMLFQNVLASHVQLSILLDTNYVHDSDIGHGVVLHLSKFSGEVTSGFLSKVIKTVLEGKEVSSMEDGENLKVKAILEYEDASDEESPPPTKRRQNSKKNGKYYDKMDTSDDSVEQVSSMGLKFSLYM